MIKAIAIDDEPLALEVIKSHSSKISFIEIVGTYTDALEALELLQREEIDLLFLDIKMPDISGFEFFDSIDKKPLVIFTTAYEEYAIKSYDFDAVDYLLKPFSLARFLKSCQKALKVLQQKKSSDGEEFMFVKSGSEFLKINFSDIYYLEAAGNYVTIVLEEKSVLVRSTFSEAMKLLPKKSFVQVHRSYAVAIDKVEKIERHQIIMKNYIVQISGAFRQNLIDILP